MADQMLVFILIKFRLFEEQTAALYNRLQLEAGTVTYSGSLLCIYSPTLFVG